jgi:hypothetical protein
VSEPIVQNPIAPEGAPAPLEPETLAAFDDAQRATWTLMRRITDQLTAGMSERDVAELAKAEAPSLGFNSWFHVPEVRFEGVVGRTQRNGTKHKLAAGSLVEIDLGPANDQAYGDAAVSFRFDGGPPAAQAHPGEPELVSLARELCRATCGFANRFKSTGELYVFADAWANNHRASLGSDKAVGHVCLPREGLAASAWPRAAHAATMLRRNQIQWFNPRRMFGIFAIRPRIHRDGKGLSFEELIVVNHDRPQLLGRESWDEIGTW